MIMWCPTLSNESILYMQDCKETDEIYYDSETYFCQRDMNHLSGNKEYM